MRPFLTKAAIVALCALSAEAEPAAGPQDNFQWAGWTVPDGPVGDRSALAIVEDADARSARTEKDSEGNEKQVLSALQIRVSLRAIAKSELGVARMPPVADQRPRESAVIPWEAIVPGVYKVTARVKYAGDPNVIGTPVQIAVSAIPNGPTAAQAFHCFDIGQEEQYGEVSFLYEVDRSLSKRLPARHARHSWRYSGFLQEVYPEYKPPEVKPVEPPKGVQISVSLPLTKYSAYSGMPPNSVRSVSLDWVKFERIQPSPSLTIRHVRAQKRWLRPGAEQTFDVGVENFNTQTFTRDLVVSLVRGFSERQEVFRKPLSLDKGQAQKLSVPWQTKPETPVWGYEVRAEIRNGDAVEHAARDVFTVHPAVYPVHLMGANYRTADPFREHENLANLMEVFAATPGDCSQIMPDGEQWLCGMSTVATSFRIVKAVTDYNRQMGVATHMYLFAGGTGQPLMDMYIRRPDWSTGRLAATDEVYRLRLKVMEDIRKHDFRQGPFEMPKTPALEGGLNHWFPELMNKITTEAVEFVRRTGYDGIRFDVGIFAPGRVETIFGEPLPFKSEDAMPHAARNFEGFKDALRKEFPDFEFGANMDSWAYLERVGRRDEKAPDPETFPEFVAFARAGGMFMDEGTMNAPFFNHYMNRFEDGLWAMCQKRAVARRYGGTYQLFSPHRDGTGYFAQDDIYWTIMIIASGSYYVGNFSAAPYCEDSPGEFITRFSEFFRSLNLKPLTDVEDKIAMESPEPLWFADAAVWEDIGDRRRYVIPIINPPVNDRMRRNKANELPSPIDEPFPVEVRLPEGFRSADAWMLTWEPKVAAIPLKVELVAGKAKVQFPGIKLFRTLVLEFAK